MAIVTALLPTRETLELRLAQQAGTIGALLAILEQLTDDMKAYHPDMHPVVRADLELFTTYKDVLLAQPANQAKARELSTSKEQLT